MNVSAKPTLVPNLPTLFTRAEFANVVVDYKLDPSTPQRLDVVLFEVN